MINQSASTKWKEVQGKWRVRETDNPQADSSGEQWQEEETTSQQVILLVVGHAVTVLTELGQRGFVIPDYIPSTANLISIA